MQITLLGIISLPLCLLCAWQPLRLLQLVLVLGVFDAAGLISLGQLGIIPALAPAGLFIGYMVLQLLLGARYPGADRAVELVAPFLVVAAWGLLTAVMVPQLFAGTVLVHPQKLSGALVPIEPDGSNHNQMFYLILNTLLLLFVSVQAARPGFATARLVETFFATGFGVAAICWWELASKLGGVWFPDDFFHSNPGYAQLSEQSIGIVPRINGPFTEPSAVGGYMSGVVGATLWLMLQGHRGLRLRLLCLVGALTVLISTSTTGIVVLAALLLAAPLYAVWRRSGRLLAWITGTFLALTLALALVFTVGPTIFPNMNRAVGDVLSGTLEKDRSDSYKQRTQIDLDSLAILPATGGLGVGWGSNRSSSLLPGLLANLGIYGVLVLLLFAARVARAAMRARRLALEKADGLVIDAATGFLGGGLLAGLIAGPTISSPGFFVMLALLIGTAARYRARERVPVRRLAAVS